MSEAMVKVMSIAGSDPGGGAGIQADLRTIGHLGLYGLSVITAVTAQNTHGVQKVFAVPREQVAAQLESVVPDLTPVATKTGMLPSLDIIDEVLAHAAAGKLGMLVIDPVTASTSGAALSSSGHAKRMIERLVPHCRLITPNLAEAGELTGRAIESASDAINAAKALVDAGAGAACVTGGHWPGAPVDYLFDGDEVHTLKGARAGLAGELFHGTGCLFSAAAMGFLALGEDIPVAVANAKRLVKTAVEGALAPGGGMKIPWLRR